MFINLINDQLKARGNIIRISQYHFNEAQRGRGMLDTHFSYVHKLIRIYVDSGNDVRTHQDLFDALVYNGGFSATITLLIRIPYDWSKSIYSFNNKLLTGSRRIHNLLFPSNA